jgi:hypothetical protein
MDVVKTAMRGSDRESDSDSDRDERDDEKGSLVDEQR